MPATRTLYQLDHVVQKDNKSPLHNTMSSTDTNGQCSRKPPPVPTSKKPSISELLNSVDSERNDTGVFDEKNPGINGICISIIDSEQFLYSFT